MVECARGIMVGAGEDWYCFGAIRCSMVECRGGIMVVLVRSDVAW